MHYALAILDKMNGTQSDAGPRMAGSPDDRMELLDALWDAVAIGSETLIMNGERREDVDHGFSHAYRAAVQWTEGLSVPGYAITCTVVPGYALRMETHNDDECTCEDN